MFLGRGTHWKSNSPSKASSRHWISKHIYKTGSFILLYLVASWPSGGSQVPPGHNNKPVAAERCLRLQGASCKCKHKGTPCLPRHSVRLGGSISLGLCRSFLTGLPASRSPPCLWPTHSTGSPFWNAQHFPAQLITLMAGREMTGTLWTSCHSLKKNRIKGKNQTNLMTSPALPVCKNPHREEPCYLTP